MPENPTINSSPYAQNTGAESLDYYSNPLTVKVVDGYVPLISYDFSWGMHNDDNMLGFNSFTQTYEVYNVHDPDVSGTIDPLNELSLGVYVARFANEKINLNCKLVK